MQFNIELSDIEQQSLSVLTDKYSEIKKQFTMVQEALGKEIREKLHKEFSYIFTLEPKIKALAWTQYTPYFMDGDTCTFSVNELNILSFVPEYHYEAYDDFMDNEEDVTEDDFAYALYQFKEDKGFTQETVEAIEKLSDFISNNEDLMEQAFGEHAHILMTAQQLEFEDYEHD